MSIGIKLGRAIGAGAALVVEGSVRGATGLGAFGADVIEGAEIGYAERHAALLVTRAANDARRQAAIAAKRLAHDAAMNAAPMVAVSAPKRTAKA
jgi:hypothetical protein